MSLTTPPFLTPPLDSEPLVTSDYAPPSVKSCEDFVCLWNNCFRTFNDAELLYLHLANDHVGRKSTGNLCLVCHWDGCGNSSKKRDHITSHLRVHVSSKPHTCERCSKSFKRPQDLKKHERTHTSQHQKKIYDSKFTRIKNQPLTPPQLLPDDSPGTSTSPSPQLPCSPNSVSSGLPAYNYYPIPHQDMSQFSDGASFEHGVFEDDYVKLKPSQKRSMDVFEGFYQDVKKQRINPKYNGDLIGKLEDVSSALDDINVDQASLPPSLRKMEDFNILEDFLAQALKEVESYSVPLYAPTNIGYSWGNPIDSGDSSCNFPDSTASIGNVYPTPYEYANTLSTFGGNIDEYCHNPRQLDNFINNDPSLDAAICYMTTQYKQSPAEEPSVITSSTSEDSADGRSALSHKDCVIGSDDDIVKQLSTLKISDNKPNIETSNCGALKEKDKHITLINSIRRKVAVFSRQLNESLVKPEDAAQPNTPSNLKNSLPTQPISGDKLNLEADSLVVVE